jgi:integrase
MRGSIVKPKGKQKSWGYRVDLGYEQATGKRRQRWQSGFDTRKDAEADLRRVLHELDRGGTAGGSKETLAEYLRRWLPAHVTLNKLAPSTERGYNDVIERHIIPAIGPVPMRKLAAHHIRQYLTDKAIEDRPRRRRVGKKVIIVTYRLSSTTIQEHRDLLHIALKVAVQDGLLSGNPCDGVKRPKRERAQWQIMDEEQLRLFLGTARRSARDYRLFLAAVYTGARQGELLALRWDDVDLATGAASIQRTFQRHGRQLVFKSPKSEKSRRIVPLHPVLVQELRQLKEKQDARRREMGALYHDYSLVFCQDDGKPLHGHNITRRSLRALLKAAGLPRMRFHDLRHTFGTHGASVMNARDLADVLGHASPAFSMMNYVHGIPRRQAEAMKQLGDRMAGVEDSSRIPHELQETGGHSR